MLLEEIVAAIETVAPLAAAAAWDCSGMQVAARRKEARRLAVCLDPVPAGIAAALEGGAECILSHHPLLLKARLPSEPDGYHEVLRLLLTADVPLYAAHTSLDVNPRGPAAWLADELGLSGRRILEPSGHDERLGELGYGLVGDLPRPLSMAGLAEALGAWIDLSTAAVSGREPESVRRLACCPGSGSGLWRRAAALGADVLVTGDVRHHVALDAEICMADVGHHSLEEEMMRRMAAFLGAKLPRMEVFFVPSASPFRAFGA